MADPEIRQLKEAIQQLTRNLIQFRPPPAQGPPGMGGNLPANFADLVKQMGDQFKEFNRNFAESARAKKSSDESFLRSLALFELAIAPAAAVVRDFTKFGLTRPLEMMGGTAGAVARGGQERAQSAGNIATAMAAAIPAILALAFPGAGMILGGVAAGIGTIGAAGGSSWLGRWITSEEQRNRAGALEQMARFTQEGVLPFRQGAILGARIGRTGQISGMLGMAGAEELAGRLGLQGPQLAEFFENAMRIGGLKGIRALERQGGVEALASLTEKGIYGTFEQVASGALMGTRAGISLPDLQAAVRRTGWQMDAVGQAALGIRQQTYFFGQGATDRLFNFVTNTQMGRDFGPQAAAFGLQGIAGAAQGRAEGNEAVEMLQYQAYLRENPGSTYWDFLEARRNGWTSTGYQRMIGGVAGGARGQMGRLIAAGIIGRAPGEMGDIANFMRQGRFGMGEMIGEGAGVRLAAGAGGAAAAELLQSVQGAALFQEKYAKELESTNTQLINISKNSGEFNQFLRGVNELMDRMSKSGMGTVFRSWAGKRAGSTEDIDEPGISTFDPTDVR